MVNRLIALIEKKGLSINAVEKALGFGNGAIKRFAKSSPSVDKIIALSKFLDVSADYILFGKEGLTDDVRELVDIYNRLTSEDKIRVIERAQTLADNYNVSVIEIRHSIYKVSAGHGWDLDDDDMWDIISIPDTPTGRKADFALTISGNSMEPVYSDSDIVLVRSQPAVELNQIGIFIVNGCGYIKKFGGDRLISLNDDYNDIIISENDDFRCQGLVIGKI